MSDETKDPLLLDHEYDGIGELDNNLPGWWLWLFYICIAFSGVYMMYYHVLGVGKLPLAKYRSEMALHRPAGEGGAAPATPTFNIPEEVATDKDILAEGQELFMTHCIACHGPQGGGLIGPNMTDDYFIHGPTFSDTVNLIITGVPAKGMIPWGNSLNEDEIYAVASYVRGLVGTTPSSSKAPEGTQSAP